MALVIGTGITIGTGISIIGDNTVGQQAYTTAGTYSWTAPAGVTSVCVVCVGGGGGGSRGNTAGAGGDSYFIDNTTVAGLGGKPGGAYSGSSGTIRVGFGTGGGYVGDGGGTGGTSYNGVSSNFYGPGGAAGYSGNGGDGGIGTGTATCTLAAGNGSGGGGGGSAWGSGGGVGILGQGSNGAGSPVQNPLDGTGYARGGSGGANGIQYPNGSPYPPSYTGGAYGGGGGGTYSIQGGGGGLGWKNNITVVPGQSYTVVVGAGGVRDPGVSAGVGFCGPGGSGAVRIIWGDGRSFPSTNTGNL